MKKVTPIRVLICESQLIFRVGLLTIIGRHPELEIAAETGNLGAAAELFQKHAPDVILMGGRGLSGGGNGQSKANGSGAAPATFSSAEAAILVRDKYPRARIIILSNNCGGEDIFRAFQAGIQGYLPKDVDETELIKAISAVYAGGRRVVPPAIAARLAERFPHSELSMRETEILKCIAEGHSNKEIARKLSISDGTVRVHASNIFAKLGCHDRAQAVSYAFRQGIIHLD